MKKFTYIPDEEITAALGKINSLTPPEKHAVTDDELVEKAVPHLRTLADRVAGFDRAGQEHAMLQIEEGLRADQSPFGRGTPREALFAVKAAFCKALKEAPNSSNDLVDLGINVLSNVHLFELDARTKPFFDFVKEEQPAPTSPTRRSKP